MSKRTRGARRPQSTRPAQRSRIDRPARPSNPSEIGGVGVEALVEGQPEAAATEIERSSGGNRLRTGRVRPNSLLAARAAEEYVYVAQDLRRIALVAGLLFGLLFVLWIGIEAFGLFGL